MSHPWQVTSADLAEVLGVVAKVVGDTGGPQPDLMPADAATLRTRLAAQGLWTVGADEEYGGGGDPAAAAAVVERVAHRCAAVAWAQVQAHAAVDALGADARWAGLVDDVNAGTVAVAVADLQSPAPPSADELQAVGLHRVDAVGDRPWLILLDGRERVWVVPPELSSFTPVGRTGLLGADSGLVRTTAPVSAADHALDADTDRSRTVLRLGAACVAAGLSAAAFGAALRYCGTREQFGASLTALATVRDALYVGARDGMSRGAGSLDPTGVDPAFAAALAEAACTAAVDVTAGAVQLHGGYGYLVEYAVERLLRDAVSLLAACDTVGARRAAALALTS